MKLTIKQLLVAFNLFWIALLPNSAFAQQQNGCLELKQLWSDRNAVTKGLNEMSVELKLRTKDCHLPVGVLPTDVSLNSDLSPNREIQSGLELKLTELRYGKTKKIQTSRNNLESSMADDMNLTVCVKTGNELAPGKYEIPAVLTYRAIDSKGDLVQQTTRIVIPVKVVASAGEVHFKDAPDPWKPLKVTGIVVVCIAALPVVVVCLISYAITGHPVMMD
jgi:hypothetical protein